MWTYVTCANRGQRTGKKKTWALRALWKGNEVQRTRTSTVLWWLAPHHSSERGSHIYRLSLHRPWSTACDPGWRVSGSPPSWCTLLSGSSCWLWKNKESNEKTSRRQSFIYQCFPWQLKNIYAKTLVISSESLHLLVLRSVRGWGWFTLTATITLWEEEERISRAELRLRCRTFSRMSEAECLRSCLLALPVISPAKEWWPRCCCILQSVLCCCCMQCEHLCSYKDSWLHSSVSMMNHHTTITRWQREAYTTYQFISSIWSVTMTTISKVVSGR